MFKIVGKLADFTIRVIILFTAFVALIYFADNIPGANFYFTFLSIMLLLAIFVKGLTDIFSKEK